jgi:hypothetical protein
MATRKRQLKSGQHLIERIHQEARNLETRANTGREKFNLRWTPGHKGIQGNELVDKAAKEAAEGKTSSKELLPQFLANHTVPASASAIKMEHKKELRNRWINQFQISPRFQKFTKIDDNLPCSKFIKSMKPFKRGSVSIMIQLRTGHIMLNKFLHHIGKTESTDCPHCRLIGRANEETVCHYIFECPAYARERHKLTMKYGRKASSFKFLLNDEDAMRDVIKFIASTGRFKNTSRDLTAPPTATEKCKRKSHKT